MNITIVIKDLGYEECASGHSFGPSVRDFYLIHFVKSGNGTFSYEDKKVFLKQNDAFLIKPNELTFYKSDDINPWTYSWFGFTSESKDDLLSSIGFANNNRCINYTTSEHYNLHAEIQALSQHKKIYPSDFLYELSKSYALLSWLSSNYENTQSNSPLPLDEPILLRLTLEYMERNYMRSISIEKLAHHVGIDRTNLFRLFKSHYNHGPKEHLIRLRMNKAMQLIKATDFQIKEISLSVGYNDPYLFSKIFKKTFGKSPLFYRNT